MRPPKSRMQMARERYDRETPESVKAEHRRILARMEVYGRTEPHDDLGAFDALGMDIIEGRA